MDLAVPFLPRIKTPPIFGFMVFSSKASFMFDWPTMAVNGNLGSVGSSKGRPPNHFMLAGTLLDGNRLLV